MKLYRAQIIICKGCIDGVGQECHSPGCTLFLHRVDLPIAVTDPVEIGDVVDGHRGVERSYPGYYEWQSQDWP
jgi:hypothetical protein